MSASPDQSEPLITATDVGLRLAGQAVLQGVNLTIPPNKVVSLIGPNGAGKTTLVRVLLGLIDVQQGTVARKDGLTVGYMPQRMAMHPALPLTVMRFLSLSQRATESAIDAALTVLRIEHLQDQQLATVSGGELQRVLLARATDGSETDQARKRCQGDQHRPQAQHDLVTVLEKLACLGNPHLSVSVKAIPCGLIETIGTPLSVYVSRG